MTPLEDLDRRLASVELDERLAACWEVFDLGIRLADAVTWQHGVDAAAALAVGAACASGRDLMPLPVSGSAVALHDAAEEATVAALDQAAAVLESAAAASPDAGDAGAWHVSAIHARDAARCLRVLRAA